MRNVLKIFIARGLLSSLLLIVIPDIKSEMGGSHLFASETDHAYIVQVASDLTEKDAKSRIAVLKSKNYPADFIRLKDSKKKEVTWYVTHLGYYADAETAEKALVRYKTDFSNRESFIKKYKFEFLKERGNDFKLDNISEDDYEIVETEIIADLANGYRFETASADKNKAAEDIARYEIQKKTVVRISKAEKEKTEEIGLYTDEDISAIDKNIGGASLALTLNDYLKKVDIRNEEILYHKYNWKIAREAIKEAESIFEPEFFASYNQDYNHYQKSNDFFGTNYLTEYKDNKKEYSAALSTLIPTGAKVKVGYTMTDLSTDLKEEHLRDEFIVVMNTEIEQPILKNFGPKVTKAKIDIAKLQEKIEFQNHRKAVVRIIADSANAYWNLRQAQGIYDIREESVKIAEKLLNDNIARVRMGQMAETEILVAEAGIELRKSMRAAARQNWIAGINTANNMIFSSYNGVKIVAIDSPDLRPADLDYKRSINNAFDLKPEYLASKIKKDLEDVRVQYSKNQRLPDLSLLAGAGTNGYDPLSSGESISEAADRDYSAWNVGFRMNIIFLFSVAKKAEADQLPQNIEKNKRKQK